MSNQLTVLFSVEARERATAVIDKVNEHIEQMTHLFHKAGTDGKEMSELIGTSFETVEAISAKLEAQMQQVKIAEDEAAQAAARLEEANRLVRDGGVAAVGALDQQKIALDELTAAERRYIAANEAAISTSKILKDTQEKQALASEAAGASSGGFAKKLDHVGLMAAGASIGIGLLAHSAAKAALHYNMLAVTIANSANTSTQAATQITDAFLTTAGTSTFSATQMATSFSKVAGQLELLNGKALNGQQALDFMRVATDSSEASGQALDATVKGLVKVMTAFQLTTDQAANASGVLYNTSRLTGVGVSQLAQQMTRMRGQLGVLSPSINDAATFMVDLTKHGLEGRQAMMAVNTSLSALLKTSNKTTPTQMEVRRAFAALPKPLKAIAKEYENGSIKAADYSKKIGTLSPALKTYATQFQSLVDKSTQNARTLDALNYTPAQQELSKLGVHVWNAAGQFVGLRATIAQLQPKLEHMTQAQQLATASLIFGAGAARKILPTILGGAAAWDKYAKSVNNQSALQAAATRRSQTYEGSMKKIEAAMSDLKITIGNALLPVLQRLLGAFAKIIGPVIQFVVHHKKAAITILEVASAITVAVGAIYAMHKVYDTLSGAFDIVKNSFKAVQKLIVETIPKMLGFGAAEAEAGGGADVMTGSFLGLDAAMAPMLLTIGAVVLAVAAVGIAIYELVKHWKAVWTAIKKVADWAYQNIILPIGRFFEALWHTLEPIFKAIAIAVLILTAPFWIMLAAVIFIVKEIITHWQSIWDAMKDAAAWVYSHVIKPIAGFFMWLWTNGIKPALDLLWAGFQMEWQAIQAIVSWIFNNIIQPIVAAFTWLWDNGIKPALDAVWAGIQSAWHVIAGIASWVYDNIIKPVMGYWSDLVGFFTSIASTISSIFTKVWDDVYNAFATVANKIINAYNSTIGLIPGMGISNIQLIGQPKPPNLATSNNGPLTAQGTYGIEGANGRPIATHRASGGPVLPSMPYIVGEHGPELFVPGTGGRIVSNGASMGGGSGNVVVNVTFSGQVYGSLNDFANKLGGLLSTNLLPRAGVTIGH